MIINSSLQTGTKYLVFDCTANSITGRFLWLFAKNSYVASMVKSGLWWQRDVMTHAILLEIYHQMHGTLVRMAHWISLTTPHSDNFQQSPREWYTLSLLFLFSRLRCWAGLFVMNKCVERLSTLYTSNSMILSTSTVCVHSIVLSMLSRWLYDISSSISNSINWFLMNFSRAGYPGKFFQQCTMHLRLLVLHTRHQVLICDAKLLNLNVFVFRFLSFPFQLGFYSKTKTVNK